MAIVAAQAIHRGSSRERRLFEDGRLYHPDDRARFVCESQSQRGRLQGLALVTPGVQTD